MNLSLPPTQRAGGRENCRGVRVTPRYITKVTDYEGRVLEEDYPEVKDVISARTARIMTAMLREALSGAKCNSILPT